MQDSGFARQQGAWRAHARQSMQRIHLRCMYGNNQRSHSRAVAPYRIPSPHSKRDTERGTYECLR